MPAMYPRVPQYAAYALDVVRRSLNGRLESLRYRSWQRHSSPPSPLARLTAIDRASDSKSKIDAYWSEHTVNSKPFRSVAESKHYLEWRFKEYPLFREFSGLWGNHDGEVILDYGCGPGNDVTGFLLYTGARRVIGVDISLKAMTLARQRVALHGIDPSRCELLQTAANSARSIPVDDSSIDFLNCQGVLMILSDPDAILAEFSRVLKAGGRGSIMIYNRDSIWYHLYTAYERMIIENAFPGLDIAEAFQRNTDGPNCPVSRCWTSIEFTQMCARAGLHAEWMGGYLSTQEMNSLKASWAVALVDKRLAKEHRDFLRALSFDFHGYPRYLDMHAGIVGTYRITKPE